MTVVHVPGTPRGEVALAAIAPTGLESTELVSPRSIEAACRALVDARDAGRTAMLLAGGTDWIVDRQLMDISRATRVDLVVDLTGVDALRIVKTYERSGERRLVLGGGVTYWMLRSDPRIGGTIPMLASMARDVGAVQIQTRGTLGGNLASASPAADGVPALMALEAVLTLASVDGTREVPVESFFTGYRKTVLKPGELIASIDVRVPRPGAIVRWQKVGTRLAQAISKVALASVVETEVDTITRARFGMASVGPTTAALAHVRGAVEGHALARLARHTVDAAVVEDIKPIDDVRSSGEYRLHVAKALVWRAFSVTPP